MKKEEEEKRVFFFKQKTAYEIKECDWSSDVCSSDLIINNSTGNTSLRFLIRPASSTDFATKSVAATGSIVVDGCQVELNQTRPSSPIFTTSIPKVKSKQGFSPLGLTC